METAHLIVNAEDVQELQVCEHSDGGFERVIIIQQKIIELIV